MIVPTGKAVELGNESQYTPKGALPSLQCKRL